MVHKAVDKDIHQVGSCPEKSWYASYQPQNSMP